MHVSAGNAEEELAACLSHKIIGEKRTRLQGLERRLPPDRGLLLSQTPSV